MTNSEPNLFTRPDTFFGICQGLGEDLRIHPNLLRVALAAMLFVNPFAAAAAYAGAGALVLLTRFLYPDPRTSAEPAAEAPAAGQSAAGSPLRQEQEERELERLAA